MEVLVNIATDFSTERLQAEERKKLMQSAKRRKQLPRKYKMSYKAVIIHF
jgi:DNA-binding ferritin-like protein (Dps family)